MRRPFGQRTWNAIGLAALAAAALGFVVVHRGEANRRVASNAKPVTISGADNLAAGVLVGPGASAALVAAVRDYERGVPGAFDRVLAAAQVSDAITVVSIGAIDPPRRAAVLARLAELSPPPGEVTVESALADPAAFRAWRDDVVDTYVSLWAQRRKNP